MPKLKFPKIAIKLTFNDFFEFFQKYSWLILITISCVLAILFIFIFYQWVYLVSIQEPQVFYTKIEFKQELYDKLKENLQLREETLERIKTKTMRDVFNP